MTRRNAQAVTAILPVPAASDSHRMPTGSVRIRRHRSTGPAADADTAAIP